jgi:glucokinase
MVVLAGDIGGTKTLLQLVEAAGDGHRVLHKQRYDSHQYDHFLDLARDFLHGAPDPRTPDRACFGVAGPVEETARGQTVETTNLPWRLDSTRLSRELDIAKVLLINDFKAIGYCVEALTPDDLTQLQHGRPQDRGPRMVLGAGTGLGVAQLLWCGGRYEVFASQGGHADFAPGNAEQAALLQYLTGRFGHVTWEHVLSGAGLVRIYEFLMETDNAGGSDLLTRQPDDKDPAAVISKAGLESRDTRARHALEIFADVYAAQAGNLALINLAFGGLYIAGGIAPKIITMLDTERFRRIFADKAKMSELLRDVPVAVIMNEQAGLLGAVQAALRL